MPINPDFPRDNQVIVNTIMRLGPRRGSTEAAERMKKLKTPMHQEVRSYSR
jgi:hypothetical protein